MTTPSAPTGPVVRPGSFCSPTGATGRTNRGTAMACTVAQPGQRAGWRRLRLHEGPPAARRATTGGRP